MSQDASKSLQDIIFVIVYKFKFDIIFGVTSGMSVFVDVSPALIVSHGRTVLVLYSLIVTGVVSSDVAAIVAVCFSLSVTLLVTPIRVIVI